MRDPFVVSSVTWHEVPDEVAIDNINLIEAAYCRLIYLQSAKTIILLSLGGRI